MTPEPVKPANWVGSLNCAIEGILWATGTQRHMRVHFFAAVAVLLLALYLRVTALEFVLLSFSITLVLFAELVNTALEAVVDLASPEYHELAKRAKDVAAGSVLVAGIGAVVMGFFSFSRYLFPLFSGPLEQLGPGRVEIPVVSVLTVCILVALIKTRFKTGTPLHGGMPSGHAAVSFSIAISIILSGVGMIPSLLAVTLACLVSHSRVLMKIHSFKEVIAGAFLGSGVSLALHMVFQ